jgi:hypothetical protein
VNGLQRLRRPEDVARARGKSIKDVLPFKPSPVEPAEAPAEPAAEAPAESEETA